MEGSLPNLLDTSPCSSFEHPLGMMRFGTWWKMLAVFLHCREKHTIQKVHWKDTNCTVWTMIMNSEYNSLYIAISISTSLVHQWLVCKCNKHTNLTNYIRAIYMLKAYLQFQIFDLFTSHHCKMNNVTPNPNVRPRQRSKVEY